MTRFDFTPLFRSTVGFDNLFRMLDSAADFSEAALGTPPYNIQKVAEDAYRITMAVPGFGPDDLTIECRENTLTISGKAGTEDDQPSYLHRGIAAQAFSRTFHLADFVEVAGAGLENGMLRIDLIRRLPEEMKPRRIEIKTSATRKIAEKAKKLVEGVSKAA